MAYLDENGLEHFWGKIKDHVSSAVAPKADDADVVHKTGDETVEGVKVFSNAHATDPVSSPDLRASSIIIKSSDLVRGVMPEHRRHLNLQLVDSTGTDVGQTGRLGSMEYQAPMQGDEQYGVYIRSWKFLPADAPSPSTGTALFVGYDKDEIPYSTAPATSDERTNSTDIVTRGFMEASEWNWQKTKKNAVVQFKPVPESDLEPVVDFVFTETPPAEGEKSPDNPSTITGVSQANVTRCGKNLCPIDKFYIGSSTGLTASANTTDGYISISGTASTSVSIYLRTVSGKNSIFASNSILRGKTYTFSLSGDAPSGVALNLFVKATEASSWIARVNVTSGHSRTYTIPATAYDAILRIDIASETTLDCKCYAQVEEGATSTPFEPYEETDYTIQLGDTYYCGSLDVTTGVMTVTHRYIVLNGTENFSLVNYGTYYQYRLNIADYAAPSGDALAPVVTTEKCTHFEIRNTTNLSYAHVIAYGVRLDFFASQQTVDSFKSWLASEYAAEHPVSVVYPLATPLTVQLTPTQIRSLPALDKYEPRINTVYTDQEAVQVGYQRYANYVDLTTDQTIKGIKKFYNDLNYTDLVGSTGDTPHFILNSADVLTKGTAPSRAAHAILPFMPKDHFDYSYANRLASIQYLVNTDKTVQISLGVCDFVADSSSYPSVILEKTSADAYCFRPSLDNLLSIGTANRRWTQVFANTATISTSDERLKTAVSLLPDEVLDAWGKVVFKQFKMSASVEEKGGSARTHCGLIAQDIKRTFEADGLDASAYGLYCYDEWEAQEESKSEDGEVLFPKREAGSQYSLRYEEALCMEAAYMRRENARLKKRIADLEERLAALELKIS